MIEKHILEGRDNKTLLKIAIEICGKVADLDYSNINNLDIFALYGYVDLIKIFMERIRLDHLNTDGMFEILHNDELQSLVTSLKKDRNHFWDRIILLKSEISVLKDYLKDFDVD